MRLVITWVTCLTVFAVALLFNVLEPVEVSPAGREVLGSSQSRVGLFTPTLALTSPCESFSSASTPVPSLARPSHQILFDTGKAIEYSKQLLLCRGLVLDYRPSETALRFQFRDGVPGMFVALGYGPQLGGFKIVYRLENDTVHIRQLESSSPNWGIKGFNSVDPAPIENLVLFPRDEKKTFKVTGVPDYGTDIDVQNFDILEIGDDVKTIYHGTDFDIGYGPGGWDKRYQYGFVDMDADGISEIVRVGGECAYAKLVVDPKLRKVNCARIFEIYKYDGAQYNLVTRERLAHRLGDDV